jgi:site-specific recombinase XerD
VTITGSTAQRSDDTSDRLRDVVSDPVATRSCHTSTPSSSRPNNDTTDGDTPCVTPLAAILVEATASLTLPFTAAAGTELVSLVIALRSLDTLRLAPWPSHSTMAAHARALRRRVGIGGDMLLTDLVVLVVHHLRTEVAAGTIEDSTAVVYVQQVSRMVEFCARQQAAITTVQEFEAARAHVAQAWVSSDGIGRDGTAVTAGANVQQLRRTVGYIAWAVLRQHGLSTIDAFRGVTVDRPPATGRTPQMTTQQRNTVTVILRSWTQDPLQRRAAGHVVDGVREAVIVALALSGATVGEIAAMRVHDVDLLAGTALLPGTGKHACRVIALAPWARTYLRMRLEELLAFNPDAANWLDLPLVSQNNRDEDMTPSGVGMRLRKILQVSGLKHLSPTAMRLWAARYAYDFGPGPALEPPNRDDGRRDLVAAAHVLGTTVSGAATALGLDPYYSLGHTA